jgi:LPXTG-motif cell wall-anchored protein
LTPKDIKSETDKEQLNKNKPAIYGLIGFCILLVFLFAFKKRKNKNEFR